MRCGAHGLAVGPDGYCALCRRDGSAPRAGGRSSPLVAVVVAIALCAAAAIAFTILRRAIAAPENGRSEGPGAPLDAAVASAEPAPSPDEEAHTEPEATSEPFGDAWAPIATAPPAPSPPATATAVAAAPAATATPSPPDPSPSRKLPPDELRAAMRRVPITMYTTQWCPHCERARRWMRANAYQFTEYDVEASESARRAQKALNPRGGVPTIDIDGQVLVGFNEASAAQALARAANRRTR